MKSIEAGGWEPVYRFLDAEFEEFTRFTMRCACTDASALALAVERITFNAWVEICYIERKIGPSNLQPERWVLLPYRLLGIPNDSSYAQYETFRADLVDAEMKRLTAKIEQTKQKRERMEQIHASLNRELLFF